LGFGLRALQKVKPGTFDVAVLYGTARQGLKAALLKGIAILLFTERFRLPESSFNFVLSKVFLLSALMLS
jgi:hypothetical protein